jgi:DNA recombination protein Rad52
MGSRLLHEKPNRKQVLAMNKEQHEMLLKGINPNRINKRQGGGGKSLSYVEAWDIKAHLNRIFGFCNWSADVTESALAFEAEVNGKWNVAYKVVLQLRIHRPPNSFMADTTYTEAAVGSATLPQRGEAHDMAIKTAESDALKRAAINLGDQFGLSLYNNGAVAPVVQVTLVEPSDES